ncbi:MAG TPA: FAD-dependent thymidylate synthase [Candidatus Polarisedimenticolia bacterium]|nr:FAD-dependent thymidylate synthase [Candidatus Polarisedimenticolia bacterium]
MSSTIPVPRNEPSFLSPPPGVTITNAFARPFDNVVATARTCYSSAGIITDEQILGGPGVPDEEREERARRRDALARDLYQAGHHTTLQHAHFQFALSNVSRQVIWSFLHSHPFYNSEQVSQRYVTVKPGNYAIPPLEGPALAIYQETIGRQQQAYEDLCRLLQGPASDAYYDRYPSRRRKDALWNREIKKKAQEVARYVLPVATFAYLYHTINGITLLRYWRTCRQHDAPLEQRLLVGRMVEELLRLDPAYRAVLEEPIAEDDLPEQRAAREFLDGPDDAERVRRFRREFDEPLGGRTSLLVDYPAQNEATLAQAVREVLGLPRERLSDDAAIDRVLDPAQNRYLGEALNLTTLSKLSRAMAHVHYTFRKKMSHAGDSQNQRHRTTPASRPILEAQIGGDPDFETPTLVETDAACARRYREAMEIAWDGVRRLRALGIPAESALYLLPNAVSIRFTESASLLDLRHKHAMRLCYNAQEEIWRASLDEALQIRAVHPRIGRWLLPPCTLRQGAGLTPVCPEGRRYCGERVWTYDIEEYRRVI